MDLQPANKRVQRLVYGGFVAITSVFVVALVAEVASQVFAVEVPRTNALSPACGSAVRRLFEGVDHAVAAGVGADDADEAVTRYREARDTTWTRREEAAVACSAEPLASAAMDALARVDRRAEGLVRRHAIERRTVRREVDSFIR